MQFIRNDSERQRANDAPVCPTDQETIVPQNPRPHRKYDKRSMEYIALSGLAGGIAGCAAKTVIGPLDRVKILFQTSNPRFQRYTGSWLGLSRALRDINHNEGVRGLFRGHSATLIRIFPYAAIKFLTYEQVRHVIIPTKEFETPFRRLISGSIAGVTSVFFAYPLELIRVRLAFETEKGTRASLRRICKQIYNEIPTRPSHTSLSTSPSSSPHSTSVVAASAAPSITGVTPRSGIANFYRGFSPTLLGMLPYAGMSFLTHDTASDWLRHPLIAEYTTIPAPPDNPRPPLVYWAQLIAGGLAGMISQTASYPLEVIRRRMQVSGASLNHEKFGILEMARKIWRERGWKGFYVGLGIGYIKVVPMVATSFLVYEETKMRFGI